MNEERETAYLELIQSLLTCTQGTEETILQTQPELVDEELVMMMLAYAQHMAEQNDPEAKSTIQWLIRFAIELAEKLGMELGDISPLMEESDVKSSLDFLMSAFTNIAQSKGNPQVVYPLFRDNLSSLNLELIPIIQTWATAKFLELDGDRQKFIAAIICEFGNLIQQFSLGNRSTNLEIAIASYEIMLTAIARDTDSSFWGAIQNSLANAYSTRIRGDRAENLEQSIEYHRAALEVRTQQDFPEDWAMTQNNLAAAYSNRIRGDRAENLEQSIECHQAALEVRTRQNFPEQWATTQNNLAATYSDRIRGDRAENLEQSIESYRAALEVRTRQDFPEDWAMTQNNLAVAYRNRIRGDRAENLEQSIECYRAALEVRTRQDFPEKWATTQNNLANAYEEIDRIDEAIECYQAALTLLTPQLLPLICLTTASNLGDLAFKQGNWQLAIDSYDLAIQAVETSRGWANAENRQELIRNAIRVYQNAIQACINHGQIGKAIEYSERARSRQLVDLMAANDLDREGEVPEQVKIYLAEYEKLEQKIQTYRDKETVEEVFQMAVSTRNSQTMIQVSEKIGKLEAQKQTVWRKIRSIDPQFAEQQQVTPIDLPTIQQLITNDITAILSFYTTDDDTHIFIITRDNEPQIYTCKGEGYESFQGWLWEHWLSVYFSDRSAWFNNMPTILQDMSDRLKLDILTDKLDGITELIIIPHLYLHQIPFSALPIGNDFLGDKFTIRFVPSCQILRYCSDRTAIEARSYGIVENPDGSLPGAVFECQQLANLFQIEPNYHLQGRKQATVAAFHELIDRSTKPITTLHLANHAHSRLDNPLESAVKLADGNITLQSLMKTRYPHLREIFLSCCETNLGTTGITDDLLTLSTGFLCAGASTVIGTLWAVYDLATALFSTFYYQHRYANYSRDIALKMAQNRLRNLTGADLRANFQAYGKANKRDRADLKAEFDRGEIDKAKFDRDSGNLTKAYTNALDAAGKLDEYSQQDKPFNHPYFWAGFVCQGLGGN
jgi:CHAT domain-containing protein